LGGYDPYSASKAGSELVAASYRSSFFTSNSSPLLATARAGNVIGGGDWSEDRLLPDLIRALQHGQLLEIRSPGSTRPWQHVLESLSGYLLLGQHLFSGDTRFAEAWNFGPDHEGNRTVSEVLEGINKVWGDVNWRVIQQPQPHEANLLHLDSTKARSMLNWKPVWNFDDTLVQTASWYRDWIESKTVASHQQLTSYIATAIRNNIEWAG
jgi:CDP-glucose 4,6-dehydratase